MARKPAAPKASPSTWNDLDRCQHADGRKGTVTRAHTTKDGHSLTVMLDDGPRSDPSTWQVWDVAEVTRLDRAIACPRCGGKHPIYYCPENGEVYDRPQH